MTAAGATGSRSIGQTIYMAGSCRSSLKGSVIFAKASTIKHDRPILAALTSWSNLLIDCLE